MSHDQKKIIYTRYKKFNNCKVIMNLFVYGTVI